MTPSLSKLSNSFNIYSPGITPTAVPAKTLMQSIAGFIANVAATVWGFCTANPLTVTVVVVVISLVVILALRPCRYPQIS
jgi:hypothetical protein